MSGGERKKIVVLGAGAFGTALAAVLARAGHDVVLQGRDEATLAAIAKTRRSAAYLGDIALPETLATAALFDNAEAAAHLVLLATPAQTIGAMAEALASRGAAFGEAPVILCAKGIDRGAGAPLSTVFSSALPDRAFGVLSGPSFATDLARGLPTAVSLAAPTLADARSYAAAFAGSSLRVYASDDVRGVELGGALKNVLAIGAGIVHGRGLGASAQAALVTRGLVEMRRLAVRLGARAETLNGLSGLGDLILTCASEQSRNFAYGAAVGRGASREGLKLAEGVATADIACALAAEHGLDVPIMATVSAVLDERLTVDAAIAALMERPLNTEQ
ncbi:MAG: NAD(P)H-dependent glycerol-3-phosphate dehydrogenase [Pseudomonadota bacterium]